MSTGLWVAVAICALVVFAQTAERLNLNFFTAALGFGVIATGLWVFASAIWGAFQ